MKGYLKTNASKEAIKKAIDSNKKPIANGRKFNDNSDGFLYLMVKPDSEKNGENFIEIEAKDVKLYIHPSSNLVSRRVISATTQLKKFGISDKKSKIIEILDDCDSDELQEVFGNKSEDWMGKIDGYSFDNFIVLTNNKTINELEMIKYVIFHKGNYSLDQDDWTTRESFNFYAAILEGQNTDFIEKNYKDKISEKDLKKIYEITGKDKYTKIMVESFLNGEQWKLKELYEALKSYDKNIFPIKALDINEIWELDFTKLTSSDFLEIKSRYSIIKILKDIHPYAYKNCTDKKGLPKGFSFLSVYLPELEDIYEWIKGLSAEGKEEVEVDRMFGSGNGLKEWMEFKESYFMKIENTIINEKTIKELVKKTTAKILASNDRFTFINVKNGADMMTLSCTADICIAKTQRHFKADAEKSNAYILYDYSKIYNNGEKDDSYLVVFMKTFLDEDGNLIKDDEDYNFGHGYDEVVVDSTNYKLSNGETRELWNTFLKTLSSKEKNDVLKSVIAWGKEE